ncbi:tryptophan synthase beta subunit-like PLP-dependent enzyme, partial [Ochromonadaceae sp. CCMP2298]
MSAYDSLIGNTPLILLRKLSAAAGPGISIYAKMECNNPAGTGKDRAVQYMLREVRKRADFGPHMTIVEGTSGSTGIALAFQCAALGVKCHVVMPDDQAAEKRQLLLQLGASVAVTPCCAIANRDHYVNAARRHAALLASEGGGTMGTGAVGDMGASAVFLDQFENVANFQAHFQGTGPEIWRQMG